MRLRLDFGIVLIGKLGRETDNFLVENEHSKRCVKGTWTVFIIDLGHWKAAKGLDYDIYGRILRLPSCGECSLLLRAICIQLFDSLHASISISNSHGQDHHAEKAT